VEGSGRVSSSASKIALRASLAWRSKDVQVEDLLTQGDRRPLRVQR
jgi:hypothetical protein